MSITKITSNEANSIAINIANKAFDHLIKDKAEALKRCALELYYGVEQELGAEALQTLKKHGLVRKTKTVTLRITHSNKAYFDMTVDFGEEVEHLTEFYDVITITDDSIHETYEGLKGDLAALNNKRESLRQELYNQMVGRSAKKMKEAWPEAAELFDCYFGPTGGGEITSPLGNLLARFLPALPAPAPSET